MGGHYLGPVFECQVDAYPEMKCNIIVTFFLLPTDLPVLSGRDLIGSINMRLPGINIYSQMTAWILAGGAAAYTLADAWLSRGDLLPALPILVFLAVGAAMAARLAVSGEGGGVRLAPSFVLVALMLLPPPAALLVALSGCSGGLGAGVVGPTRSDGTGLLAVLVPVGAVQFLHSVRGTDLDPASGAGLGALLMLFILIQGLSLGLGGFLGLLARTDHPERPTAIALLAETINIPLAWLLISFLLYAGAFPSVVFGMLILLGSFGLRQWDRALRDIHETHDALAARATELATLHSIGRQILSSLDPSRVFFIVDRECQKIFDLDVFFIALADRETRMLHLAYRRRRGKAPEETMRPLGEGLASLVAADKRGLRVNDATPRSASPVFDPELVDLETRSYLAVPLIVEDEVIGVLSVQSRRPEAYDDHHLSVLTTIAQQAAVAIENARHYEMATVDSLTGLFLRPYFFRRVEEEYNRARRYRGSFGLLMMDLDGFKAINDRCGHLSGDRYLKAFGATILDRLRAADLACRYGGDEFCLLLPETDLAGAQAIAERIREDVGDLVVRADALALRTTVSIGVAAFPDHHIGDLKALLRKADQALYRAKQMGRDRVVRSAARGSRTGMRRLAHFLPPAG